jgi:hypothetical protein
MGERETVNENNKLRKYCQIEARGKDIALDILTCSIIYLKHYERNLCLKEL